MRISRDRDIEQTSWREASQVSLAGLLLLVRGGWGWEKGLWAHWRHLWPGQAGEWNHAGGPGEGMTQELVMVVRKATWRRGNPGISHRRKTLVTHPLELEGQGYHTRASEPRLPGVGTKKETQSRAGQHPGLLHSHPRPPSAPLSLVTACGPSGHTARQKKATSSGLTPRPMQISTPSGAIGSGWG